jgi:hypothetical protein
MRKRMAARLVRAAAAAAGVAERLNSKIMSVKRKVGSFRNPDHFTIAIYFHRGGLDLYPC